jgi:hypothetical protein
MRTEDDPADQEFEFQTVLYLPPHNQEQVVQEGKFFFSIERPLFRIVTIANGPPFEGPGVFRIESRIRRAEEEGWSLRQDYPIPVVEVPPPSSAETPSGNGRQQ